ncbi:MAG: FecR family protein, partial [Treponema sp.]|nr:FecR family protein [Treponema sp.]
MWKKKSTRSRASDLFILIFCLAGTCASGLAFWREYNRTLVKFNEDPVGTIVFKNRTAHRKIEDRVAWDRLKQESPVYNGDTIRTAEESQAIVSFLDEVTSVNLSENTLIRIFYDEKGARIDFSRGNLDVSSGSGTVLVSNGTSAVEVRSGSRVDLTQDGNGLGLSVLGGQVSLDGAEVASGEVLFLNNDGTSATGPLVAVTSPGAFFRIYGDPGELVPVDFSWNVSNFRDDTRIVVEVAEDGKFSRVVEARNVRDASSVSIPLENGVFWWRVYPAGESGEPEGPIRPSGKIEVLSLNPLSLVSPLRAQEFALPGGVPFSWSPMEGARGYLLEISANQDMSNPAVSRGIEGTSVVQNGLESGRWYWRVTPFFSAETAVNTAGSRETGEFTVSAAGAALPSPRLGSPPQNGILGIENPRLFWKYDPGVSSWTVEVADNPQLSDPVVKLDTDMNYHTLPPSVLESGRTYYWRVTANGGDAAGSSSAVGSFTAAAHTGT